MNTRILIFYLNTILNTIGRANTFFQVAILFFLSMSSFAQSSFFPQSVGPNINTIYDDINPVISPDEKTLYFVRVNHPENTYGFRDSEDIWYSELQYDGTWSQAKRIPNLNIGRYNAVLAVSSDGNTLLLNGIYNKRGNIWKERGLSTSTRLGDNMWGTPKPLKISKLTKRNRGLKSSGTMSADGQYIILSFSRVYNSKKSNLFLCEKKRNGKWKRPRPIKALNSFRGSEDTPFLQADNKTLYFSSNYETKSNYNIYKVTRMADDWKHWSTPVPLSDSINSEGWDAYLKTNEKGSWAYFSSVNKSNGGADIFKVKLFEENPFIVVSGRIVHAKTNRPLIGKEVNIFANGAPGDSVAVNPDSATYRITLPLRAIYTLTAQSENYTPVPATVDVSQVREFTRMDLNLKVIPLPYVQVRGKLLNANQGTVIPASANPIVYIDGKPADSVSIDPVAGTYSVKLNYGASHYIQVRANRYESKPMLLDLTQIDDYRVVVQDLHASQEKMAIVTGRIIDKKTNRKLASNIPVSIKVEGRSSVFAAIDTLNGTYELQLPLGAAYTISANAPNYYPLYENINVIYERGNIKILKDLIIVPIEVGQSVTLNNIFFESGKAALKRESFEELNRVINFMKENQKIKIEIAGHTDNVGSSSTNLKLSQARAKAVAGYISSRGISYSRIISKGYGFMKPVASNRTAAGRAKNRRVEFTILDK